MKVLAVILGMFVLIIIIVGSNSQNAKTPLPPDPESDAALLAVMAVRKAQRNPDSFVLEQAMVMDKAVCLAWRGQNGFGGMNRGQSVVARDLTYAFNDHENGFIKAWNRDCANKSGRDLTSIMQGHLRYNSSYFR